MYDLTHSIQTHQPALHFPVSYMNKLLIILCSVDGKPPLQCCLKGLSFFSGKLIIDSEGSNKPEIQDTCLLSSACDCILKLLSSPSPPLKRTAPLILADKILKTHRKLLVTVTPLPEPSLYILCDSTNRVLPFHQVGKVDKAHLACGHLGEARGDDGQTDGEEIWLAADPVPVETIC